MNSWFKQHGPEWIYRAMVLIALCIIGWLNQNYASRAEVGELGQRMTVLETTIKVMIESNKINDRQDVTLNDHENRLRTLENRPVPRVK